MHLQGKPEESPGLEARYARKKGAPENRDALCIAKTAVGTGYKPVLRARS